MNTETVIEYRVEWYHKPTGAWRPWSVGVMTNLASVKAEIASARQIQRGKTATMLRVAERTVTDWMPTPVETVIA